MEKLKNISKKLFSIMLAVLLISQIVPAGMTVYADDVNEDSGVTENVDETLDQDVSEEITEETVIVETPTEELVSSDAVDVETFATQSLSVNAISVNSTPSLMASTQAISGPTEVVVGGSITLTSDRFINYGWSSNNSNANVSGNGKSATVTGVSAGLVTVSHNYATLVWPFSGTETYNVTVIESTIFLDKDSVTLFPNETETVTASVHQTDAVTWTTSDPSVATVNNGVITAVAGGTATVTATNKAGKTATVTVTVQVPTLVLNETEITLKEDGVGTPSSATPTVDTTKTIPSTDTIASLSIKEGAATGVVYINGTTINAMAAGTTTVVATSSTGCTAEIAVTVLPGDPALEISASTDKVKEGNTLQVSVDTKYPVDSTVTWTSSNTSIATVDSNGLVTGVKACPDPVTITASITADVYYTDESGTPMHEEVTVTDTVEVIVYTQASDDKTQNMEIRTTATKCTIYYDYRYFNWDLRDLSYHWSTMSSADSTTVQHFNNIILDNQVVFYIVPDENTVLTAIGSNKDYVFYDIDNLSTSGISTDLQNHIKANMPEGTAAVMAYELKSFYPIWGTNAIDITLSATCAAPEAELTAQFTNEPTYGYVPGDTAEFTVTMSSDYTISNAEVVEITVNGNTAACTLSGDTASCSYTVTEVDMAKGSLVVDYAQIKANFTNDYVRLNQTISTTGYADVNGSNLATGKLASLYTVTFANYDGSVLQTVQVYGGQTPSYTGSTPTRASDGTYTYRFFDWDNPITVATTDTTYTAVFSRTAIPVPPAPTPVTPVTPTPVTPVTPAVTPVTPVTPDTTPSETITPDTTPTADTTTPEETITPDPTPEAEVQGTWALSNLLMSIGTAALSVVTLLFKKKSDEDVTRSESFERRSWPKALGVVIAVVGAALFFLTENMSNPMVWFDKYTIAHLLLTVGQCVNTYLGGQKLEPEEDEETAEA
ncbi:MAG: Ig-like domain-containing protein [Erysipelotrichaceae bacterium]|nr:Ig-like domain-containing protein [Erysipelotrichaceae bacterium]